MIIIVEGPDGAGKTTHIRKLQQSHPGSVVKHFGTPKTAEEADNYWLVYLAAINASDPARLTIFDRCWLSDMVYGPVMRGRREMTNEYARMLETCAIVHGGCSAIYCTAPIDVLWERCRTRGETYITSKDVLEKLSEGYRTVMTQCSLPVVRYDTAARW